MKRLHFCEINVKAKSDARRPRHRFGKVREERSIKQGIIILRKVSSIFMLLEGGCRPMAGAIWTLSASSQGSTVLDRH